MTVRPATAADHLTVLRIVNGAMLEIDASEVERKIDAGDVLVAEESDRLLGAAVFEPRNGHAHIDAIAVRRARRGQGIGSELVEAAVERYGTLTAECDGKIGPFYESLGFEIETVGNDEVGDRENEGDEENEGNWENEGERGKTGNLKNERIHREETRLRGVLDGTT